jgi:hypothetical protein
MKTFLLLLVLAFLSIPRVVGQDGPAAAASLQPFESEEELVGFLDDYFEAQERMRREEAAPSAAPPAGAVQLEGIVVSGLAADESVTNVQHAGVDEGGIVKVHGDHLVILRRGRLFTVNIADHGLAPVAAVDAFAPGIDPRGAWYDEMLITGNIVIVIGYSYNRAGTEVGLFEIDRAGGIEHRSTYHLRSNDYYSSRNYASRLVEGKLVFYTPLGLWEYRRRHRRSLDEVLPAMRRWRDDGAGGRFEPIASATSIFRPARDLDPRDGIALHTVTTCDVTGGEMSCDATAVLGPPEHAFYVSPGSVYVWAGGWSRGREAASMVYRMPLSGARPSALGVAGSPIDQFSFLESPDDHLNVVVSARGGGQWMWHAERPQGELSLLRVPLSRFGDGSDDAPASAYLDLPSPSGYGLQNRFVGGHLLYGTGRGGERGRWGETRGLFVVDFGSGRIAELPTPHGVDRIEAMGSGAVVVGSDRRDLHFTSVRLDARPEIVDRYRLRHASQGETRSHGFFYRPDDQHSGVLGLPVRSPDRATRRRLTEGSASIVFLRNDHLRFTDLGELDARPESAADDGCRASCVDWYGNARPLFLRGRVFALLGYELVEGAVRDGRISEVRRSGFAPVLAELRRR